MGGKLNIESLQDEERFKTKSSGGGLEGEFGFGNNWSVSGYGNASKGTTHRKQVNEQAGIFAEDGGYHINADSVHLKGGAIASTNPKNSELATNKLTFEDIQNESSSSAASASISGSIKESKEKWVDNETGSEVKPNTENSTKLDSQRSGGISPGLPMFERDSDSSVTRATLTEGTIILNKDTNPTITTAKELGINTDLAQANNQVAQTKDVKAQLQEQQQISTAIGNMKSAVDTYTSNKQEEAEQEVRRLKSRLEKAEQQGNQETVNQLKEDILQAEIQAENWGTGGSTKRAVDAITHAGLIALSGGSSQSIATAAASPYVNQLIKKATEDYPALNIPTHILWGAVEAELMGGKASTGAISTAAGELGAKYLTEHLYNKEAKDLTETERNQVKEMAKALAGVAGGLAAAGQGASAVKILSESSIGTTVTHNAVENNYLSVSESKRKADLEAKKAKGTITSDEDQELTLLDKTDIDRDVALVSACRSNPLSSECNVERKKLESIKVGYTASENRSSWYGYPVYERYSDIYPEQSEKINKFSYDYDVLRITKENANKAFSERFGLSKETVDRIDIGGNLLNNLLAGYSAGKINPKDLHTAQKGSGNAYVDPRTEKLKSVVPTGRQMLDPSEVSFSQATVSYQKKDKSYNYDTMVEDMRKNGWNGHPVDVVNMPDNAPTSMDNTRILAARKAGIQIDAIVHNHSDRLSYNEIKRFKVGTTYPKTWGEAIELRVKRQSEMSGVDKNWSTKFPHGSLYDPKVVK